MTWVIAASSKFKYGVLISDIQVTYNGSSTKDILQKIYPIGNYIIGGFSGSVKLGFILLQSLIEFIKPPPEFSSTEYCWGLEEIFMISNDWMRIAKEIYNNEQVEERDAGAKILLVCATPSDKPTIFSGGEIMIIRFVAPDFEPQFMKKVNGIWNIGCGSSVRKYQEALRGIMKIENIDKPALDSRLESEIRYPGFSGKHLGLNLTKTLLKYPQPGISKHLHISIVRPGSISFDNNDMGYSKENRRLEIKMPEVATNYQDFLSKSKLIAINPIGAKC